MNPSWLIASSTSQIPTQLSPDSPPTKINLHIHPEPIRVAYDDVAATVTALHNTHSESLPIDLTIHIGMAAGRKFYTLETLAHRDGYTHADVDGNLGGGNSKRWESWGAPPELAPGVAQSKDEHQASATQEQSQASQTQRQIPVRPHARSQPPLPPTDANLVPTPASPHPPSDTVTPSGLFFTTTWTSLLQKWQSHVPDADLRLSSDAGRFLCDHIYYTSLAHLWREGRTRSVLFLHVPADTNAEGIEKGRRVLLGLIRVASKVIMEGKCGQQEEGQ